jgi:hypothetical protein
MSIYACNLGYFKESDFNWEANKWSKCLVLASWTGT